MQLQLILIYVVYVNSFVFWGCATLIGIEYSQFFVPQVIYKAFASFDFGHHGVQLHNPVINFRSQKKGEAPALVKFFPKHLVDHLENLLGVHLFFVRVVIAYSKHVIEHTRGRLLAAFSINLIKNRRFDRHGWYS